MESGVVNLLYRRPELYESVYHGADHAVPRMCERLFHRHLGGPPASILNIGCGTGRDLEYLVPGGEPLHDSVRFRLLYPMELAYFLANHGFEVLETYDNTDLVAGEWTGPSLFVVAVYRNGKKTR